MLLHHWEMAGMLALCVWVQRAVGNQHASQMVQLKEREEFISQVPARSLVRERRDSNRTASLKLPCAWGASTLTALMETWFLPPDASRAERGWDSLLWRALRFLDLTRDMILQEVGASRRRRGRNGWLMIT